MFRYSTVILAVLLTTSSKPKEITPHEIFDQDKRAVVRVFVDGRISGCGFVVSKDGLIITANHVVTTEESKGVEVYKTIEVQILGEGRSHAATVIDHSYTSDTALLNIPVDNLPYVELGNTSSVKEGDQTTLITYLPDGNLPILIAGPVSFVGPTGPPGTTQLNTVIAQLPVRKGFSGSPIFDSRGRVIGIITTRLVGISPDLEAVRQQLKASKQRQLVQIQGVEFADTILELIDSLDSDLVSGLGSAVDISYAEQMVKQRETNKQ